MSPTLAFPGTEEHRAGSEEREKWTVGMNGHEGSADPKHSEILSQACRSHESFKNRKGGILFISLLQS